MTPTIAVTEYDWPDLSIELEVASEYDIELRHLDAPTPADIIERGDDADALLVQYAPVPAEVFEALEDLRAVGRTGIGVDNVDLAAASEHGVTVVNVPSYCEDEVTVHTLALLFATLRKVTRFDRAIKQDVWDWTIGKPIGRFAGRTWGLVGFGKIPRRLARYLSGFDINLVAYDPYVSADEMGAQGVEKVSYEDLLDRSTFVSIHAPLTPETEGLVDAAAFERMSEDSIVINTARGGLLDLDALDNAITNGKIRGAGIDVMPNEPPENFDVLSHDEVVATPHVAWYSEDSNVELRRTVTQDLAGILTGEAPMNPVNE